MNGHVTFVAPRVAGQISRVLVDDNNRVHKGDLLAALDKEPYRVAVSEKQAAVDTAKADLQAATAAARAIEAQAVSRRWDLQHAVEDVDNQVALLHARVAAVEKSKAALALAQLEFDRAKQLVARDDVPREVYDRRQAELTTAGAELAQTLAEVYQIRVSLGLPAQPDGAAISARCRPISTRPFRPSSRRRRRSFRVPLSSASCTRSTRVRKRCSISSTNWATSTRRSPGSRPMPRPSSRPRRNSKPPGAISRRPNWIFVTRDIIAEIDGVVTRRNVNPGNYVQVGQNLMAVRSLNEIWVDANFKETQLRDLRIGQPVDLRVDMYGGKHVFKGRVSGFTEGTGSTLALLPPENATGNFIKVVQRLPVRIDLVDYNADQTPLFIGTSVVPYVYINKPPTGPDAGKFLQAYVPPPDQLPPPSPAPTASASGARQ